MLEKKTRKKDRQKQYKEDKKEG
jgi:hypothetical protein